MFEFFAKRVNKRFHNRCLAGQIDTEAATRGVF